MEEVFGYIFFRYICVLSIYENKLMKIFGLPGGGETYMYCSQNVNVRQCCGNDVDYNIQFVIPSKHLPAPSEPQIYVVPLTYAGKINIRKSEQTKFYSPDAPFRR